MANLSRIEGIWSTVPGDASGAAARLRVAPDRNRRGSGQATGGSGAGPRGIPRRTSSAANARFRPRIAVPLAFANHRATASAEPLSYPS